MDYKDDAAEEKAGLVGTEKPAKDGSFRFKLKALGSLGKMDMHFRADKIDLKSLDIHLAKRFTKGWRSCKIDRHMKEWEIDLSMLDLRHELARGTYATVYKGVYDGHDVAVKMLDWGEDGSSTEAEIVALRETFQKEVIVWHKLDHPNVTKFIGASVGSNELKIPQKSSTSSDTDSFPARSCCVVVEFLAGGTLKQFLIRHSRRKLTYKTVIRLALDLSRGLSYLHSQKIVHRDVKTENMLLDKSANLKIADFGVARVEAQNAKDMTGETGTLGYMAPEVLNGKPYNRNAMYIASAYACGRSIAATCLTGMLVLLKYPMLLLVRT
ncbi:Serine/threonine-protein kinase HT1 [Platanthera zijinensis]|uniref:Serine/threonine-protein kinase HT1 n=1 Tax=Platanthera zijinensis TaxID=2320716 RepID=A0AAP0GDW3_9ASPA